MSLYVCLGLTLVAAAYQLIALIACLRQLRQTDPEPSSLPPISILKPVRGLDPRFYDAIRSHAEIDYPEYELLFGVSDPADPAIPQIERLCREYPQRAIRLIHSGIEAPNGKVGVLMDLAPHARHGIWIVNDSDISVPPDYLRNVAAPLERPGCGLVTCLYRPKAETAPARFEALGIATDFAPSILVAPLFGVAEFGLGSTLVFRREWLNRIGGFAAIAEYIADDYQLGKRISGLGLRNHLTRMVVETNLGGDSWGDIWRHQVRWARTIRVSRGGGYAGLPATMASVWAALDFALGYWQLGAALLLARFLMAFASGWLVLRSGQAMRDLWLVPVRDLWGFGVWLAGLKNGPVVWRDRLLTLRSDGRIEILKDI